MIYIQLFWAFFVPGIIGYGGGPASIPLMEKEVVGTYSWLTTTQFSELLALGNALPGPIATKIAAYVGFEVAGIPGAVVALLATIGPSLLLMLVLLNILYRNRNSPRVKRLSSFVLPVIAILMAELTFGFFQTSVTAIQWIPTIVMAVFAYLALERFKVHPAIVILVGLVVGGVFL